MPRTQLPMTGGFYVSRSLAISNQECKNLYTQINEGGGLANESLIGTPGIHQLATSGANLQANRGAHVMNGIAYFVNGTTLYRLTRTVSGAGVESFSLDSLGTIAGTNRVSMADNGTQLLVLTAGTPSLGYIWNEGTTTFTAISDPDFTANGNPQHVVYIDGYFLLTTDTKKFIISSLNNGLAYDALDRGSAEADPDEIVAPIVLNNQLYILGTQTIEQFRNAGESTGAGFPFIRIEGGGMSVGVLAENSPVKTKSAFYFIGAEETGEPGAYVSDGNDAVKVSTEGIDNILGDLSPSELDQIFAWTYSQGGQTFVGWILPGTAIVLNVTANRWHERKSFSVEDGTSSEFRWRVNSIVRAYNRTLVGDFQDGRVGELDLDFYDEYGQSILRQFSTLPFSNLGNALRVPYIELSCESGVGNDVAPDPQVSLAISKNGVSFSKRREKPLGKVGKYNQRQIWYKNGRAARFDVFRFSTSAKAKIVFIKLEADLR